MGLRLPEVLLNGRRGQECQGVPGEPAVQPLPPRGSGLVRELEPDLRVGKPAL